MKTGDLLTDGSGRAWTIGQLLGRGTWGKTWAARDDTGREGAIKEPFGLADLPADLAGAEGLVAICREIAEQTADWLEQATSPAAPRLEGRLKIPGVGTAVITPRYPTSLGRKLDAGNALDESLDLLCRVVVRLAEVARPHGNLRASNIFLSERGDVVLGDPLVPALAGAWGRLAGALGDREGWRPPEARDTAPAAGWDTWAICAGVHQAVLCRPVSGDRRPTRAAVPVRGIDRVELAALKDRALARLAEPGSRSNPRFRSRLADRLGSLLNRGLSLDHDPSPPYRFETPGVLRPRLEEVASLVAPAVTEVGRLLPGGGTTEGVFRGGEPVSFAVTVACTPGITDHEDLACGLQLADLDAEEQRIPLGEAKFGLKTHPSGRLRFEFTLPDVAPGRYRLRAAFSMRDSGDDPRLAETEFQVRPPPGWVPPAREAGPAPLTLPGAERAAPRDPTADSESAAETVAERTSSPGAEVIDGLFPRPLAPPSEDSDLFRARENPARPREEAPTRTAVDPPSFAPPARVAPRLVPVEVDPTGDDEGEPRDSEPSGPHDAPFPQIRLDPSLHRPPAGRMYDDRPLPPLAAPHVAASVPMRPTPPPEPTPRAPSPLRGPGRWEEAAAEEDELAIGGGLPGRGGEDLPDIGRATDSDMPIGPFDRLLEMIRGDSRVAIGSAIAASLLLILITMAVLRAC